MVQPGGRGQVRALSMTRRAPRVTVVVHYTATTTFVTGRRAAPAQATKQGPIPFLEARVDFPSPTVPHKQGPILGCSKNLERTPGCKGPLEWAEVGPTTTLSLLQFLSSKFP
jgi:hypothetical protein